MVCLAGWRLDAWRQRRRSRMVTGLRPSRQPCAACCGENSRWALTPEHHRSWRGSATGSSKGGSVWRSNYPYDVPAVWEVAVSRCVGPRRRASGGRIRAGRIGGWCGGRDGDSLGAMHWIMGHSSGDPNYPYCERAPSSGALAAAKAVIRAQLPLRCGGVRGRWKRSSTGTLHAARLRGRATPPVKQQSRQGSKTVPRRLADR